MELHRVTLALGEILLVQIKRGNIARGVPATVGSETTQTAPPGPIIGDRRRCLLTGRRGAAHANALDRDPASIASDWATPSGGPEPSAFEGFNSHWPQDNRIGPKLFGTISNIGPGTLKWNGGILFGVTAASPRETIRWQLEYEIHF